MNKRVRFWLAEIATGIAFALTFLLASLLLLLLSEPAQARDVVCELPHGEQATLVEWQYAYDLDREVWQVVFSSSTRRVSVDPGCHRCRFWFGNERSALSQPKCIAEDGCHND